MRVSTGRTVLFAAAVLWLLFIWSNSLQTADESSQVSLSVLEWFAPLFGWIRLPEELWHTLLRKLAHMTEFAVAGLLWPVALSIGIEEPLHLRWRRRGMAFLVCLAAAVADETIQHFVPGRSCELRDVCIDLLGAALGILAAAVIGEICRTQRKHKRA